MRVLEIAMGAALIIQTEILAARSSRLGVGGQMLILRPYSLNVGDSESTREIVDLDPQTCQAQEKRHRREVWISGMGKTSSC